MWKSTKLRKAREVLEKAISNHAFFKLAGRQLEQAPVDEGLAQRLVEAYEAGDAPPWFTAYLLGCVGHEAGYETVRAILVAAPRQLAESYAGPALAKIRGEAARADLMELMHGAPTLRGREGAAGGIVKLGGRQAGDAIVGAIRRQSIRTEMGSALATLGLLDTLVVELLSSDEECDRQAGFNAVFSALAYEDRRVRVPRIAVETALGALEASRVRASPRIRAMALERAREVLA